MGLPPGASLVSGSVPPPPMSLPPGATLVDSRANQSTADPDTLSKIWEWANKGLISGKTLLNVVGDMMPRDPEMKPGETTSDFLDRVQNHIDPDHPYINALKVGLAGVDKDAYKTVSSLSSPLSLALMGAGTVAKLGGTAATAAKTLL